MGSSRRTLVLAVGAGLAKPVIKPARGAQARVILVDASRSARDSLATRDSVRAIYRNNDALVVFDSSARVITGSVGDTINALRSTSKRGNMSAALIAAMRAGSRLRYRADSLELVIVSPFAAEELDAATDSIRKLWPGKARLIRVGKAADAGDTPGKLEISADAADPLRITVALARNASAATALIARSSIQSPQRLSSLGRALVEWPASTRPTGAIQREVSDTIGGVLAGDALVIAAFERGWAFPVDSLRGSEVIARWADGEPAAIERPDGVACTRSVAVPVSPAGDLVIRQDFVRFVVSLSGACSQKVSLAPAGPAALANLEGQGGFAGSEAFEPSDDVQSSLAPWLLALAIAAAIAELFVRRRRADARNVSAIRSSTLGARAA